MVAQSNKYLGNICGLRPFLFSLATDFPLFNLDAGSMPTLLDSTVSLPFLIQPRHELVCMK